MTKPKKIPSKTGTMGKDHKRDTVEKIVNGKVQKLRVNIKDCNKSKRQPLKNLHKNQDENISKACFLNLRRGCKPSYDKSFLCNALPARCNDDQKAEVFTNEVKCKELFVQKSKPSINVVTRSKAKTGGLEAETKPKKLYDEKGYKIVSNLKDAMVNRQQCHPNSMSNNNTIRCVVKLPKISAAVKAGNIEPIINTRNVAIRLKNCEDSVSSNHSVSMPVIDDNKRKNFRKLSLTKSLKKIQDNKEMEKVDTSIHPERDTEISTTIHSDEKKSNELAAVKQIPKLSLKRRNNRPNQNITNLRDSQFKTPENFLTCFQLTRNSILLDGKEQGDKAKANAENKTTTSTKKSFRNLANKSDEIENLLNSIDDEEEILLNSTENSNKNHDLIDKSSLNKSNEKDNESLITKNKNNKFFHREKDITENILEKLPPKNSKCVKNQKKRLSHTKRSTVVRREKIYEFLSQSQTSDSDVAKNVDPSADIIEKLIKQGKVRVATNCKGKGKPKFKRLKPQAKQTNKNKTNKKQPKNNTKKVIFTKENKDDPVQEDRDFEDHFNNDEYLIDFDDDINMQTGDVATNARLKHKSKDLASEQEGTFSRLARSVLINQAGRSNPQGKKDPLWPKNSINFISTPKNRRMPTPQTILETDLSPIAMPPARPATKPSPWRVNEEAHLPKTFNFSRSSGNLPSFSSDFIPSTPMKEKSKVYLNWSPNKTSITSEKSQTINKHNDDVENVQPQIPNLGEPSVISSFSSNDSNAENMPPDKGTSKNCNENENIFNLKQLPNPRRTLNCRSPLKAINIIEIVQLPPYKHPDKTTNTKEMLHFDQYLEKSVQVEQSVEAVSAEAQSDASNTAQSVSKDDLFGFEDYLSQTHYSSQVNTESEDYMAVYKQNQTISDKLHDLRRLKPAESELEKNITNPVKSMPLFDDDVAKADGMRQRGIKEMLCSTMIHPEPSTSKEALRQLNTRNLRNTKLPKFGDDTDVGELFKDAEPETTFNENEAHRTYIRPHKRKRRLRENKFVVYLESDQSEDEDSQKNQNRQHSKESNSSSEQAPKKTRHHREPKKDLELIEFVEEFNKLCKDVDSYHLIVERSA